MHYLNPFCMFSRVEWVIYSQENQFSLRHTLINYNKPMTATATFSCWWLCLHCRPKSGLSAWQTLNFFTASSFCCMKEPLFMVSSIFVALHESTSFHTHGREKLSPWTVVENLIDADGWNTRVSTGTNRRSPENEEQLSSQFTLCHH